MNADIQKSTPKRQKFKQDYRKNKVVFFALLALILLGTAIFAEYICPYDPNTQDFSIALQKPGPEHLFGTDRYGRDLLSRVIAGSQTSIFSTLILVSVISVCGTVVGMICGYFGGILDSAVMRISDICLAFPGLVFALAIAAVLNGGIQNAVIALAVISWPKYSRIARSQTLALKSLDFIAAARLSGSPAMKILIKHILPGIIGPVLVTAMLDIGTMMMELAALSFLGLGAQPPTAEWGSMMSGGRSMLQTYPWTILAPGFAIFITVTIFNLLGDAVRDYADPRNTQTKG